MTKEVLRTDTFTVSFFEKINNKLSTWDLSPVTGKGMYLKHHHYAHVELTMYTSAKEDYNSYVIWNFPVKNIAADMDYKAAIEKSLIFFLRYITAFTGSRIYLTFEINDATFHPADTRSVIDYEIATLYAIINCFDDSIFKFNKEVVDNIKNNYWGYTRR